MRGDIDSCPPGDQGPVSELTWSPLLRPRSRSGESCSRLVDWSFRREVALPPSVSKFWLTKFLSGCCVVCGCAAARLGGCVRGSVLVQAVAPCSHEIEHAASTSSAKQGRAGQVTPINASPRASRTLKGQLTSRQSPVAGHNSATSRNLKAALCSVPNKERPQSPRSRTKCVYSSILCLLAHQQRQLNAEVQPAQQRRD